MNSVCLALPGSPEFIYKIWDAVLCIDDSLLSEFTEGFDVSDERLRRISKLHAVED